MTPELLSDEQRTDLKKEARSSLGCAFVLGLVIVLGLGAFGYGASKIGQVVAAFSKGPPQKLFTLEKPEDIEKEFPSTVTSVQVGYRIEGADLLRLRNKIEKRAKPVGLQLLHGSALSDSDFEGWAPTIVDFLLVTDCPALSDRGVASIVSIPSLKGIRLEECSNVSDSGFVVLLGCSIEHIGLSGVRLSSDAFSSIEPNPSLRNLYLDNCQKLGGNAIAMLSKFPNLENLRVTKCKAISGAYFAPLAMLSKLRFIDISGSSFSGNSIMSLQEIPSLRTISAHDLDEPAYQALLRLKKSRPELEIGVD